MGGGRGISKLPKAQATKGTPSYVFSANNNLQMLNYLFFYNLTEIYTDFLLPK